MSPVTTTSSQSWFSRLGNSIVGIFFGILLILGGMYLLFWNEGNAVKTYKSLVEGAGIVQSVPSDAVDPANDGKLVHVVGKAETSDVLSDEKMGVSENAIKLKREVLMYQWKEESKSETKKKLGGGTETTTTYSYKKDWSPTLIKSVNFKEQEGHENPASMPMESDTLQASNVTLGAFTLNDSLIGSISNYEKLTLDEAIKETLSEEWREKAQVQGNTVHIGNTTSPEIGDMRIEFEIVRPSEVSVIAKQSGASFSPYKTEVGKTIELLSVGEVSAEQMFEAEQTKNTILTWVLRFLGFLLIFIGFKMILQPLVVLGDVVPFIGSIINFGTGLISGILAFSISLIVIAISWFAHRPLLAGILILVAVGAVFAFKRFAGNKGTTA